MMFDGRRFRHARKVVFDNKGPNGYVRFLRLVKPGTKGASDLGWKFGSDPKWCKVIESDGYSLTNLMYGKDGKMYLAYDGCVYSCPA